MTGGLSCCISLWSFDARGVSESCDYRAASREVGQMPSEFVDEASGLVSLGGGRFYVINDSGDRPRFFRVNIRSKPTGVEEFLIEGWKPFDLEDLALGPCPQPMAGECLALADIGDNRESRPSIAIGFFPLKDLEQKVEKPISVKPGKIVRLKYPKDESGKRSYNAEAFALLGNERAVIITKNQSRKSREAEPATVFEADLVKAELRKVGTWNVPTWVKDRGLAGLVTGMSVHPSELGLEERRFLLLTYQNAVELRVNMTKVQGDGVVSDWKIVSKRVIGLDYLEQQEAIAYNEDNGFFYTTELPLKFLNSKAAPIRLVEKVKCP